MNIKSIVACELKSLDKLKRCQLPHMYKKVGLGIIVVSVISSIGIKLFIDDSMLKQVAMYGILLGLLVISISKEKIEDELITSLRMQSYAIAFIAGVFITLTHPILSYVVFTLFEKQHETFQGMGDWQILWILLGIQVFYFELLKRTNK